MQWVVHKCLTGSVDLKRVEAKQRSFYWRFLILKVSYTTSTLPTGKQLTRNSTWRSCEVYVTQIAEKDRKNGGMTTGSCTTTMRPHTLLILCSSFWPNTAPLSCSSRHTQQISQLLQQAYGEDSMGRTQVFDWFRRFEEGRSKQRSFYWRFLILSVSYTTSTLPTGKQLTGNSTWRSCDLCVIQIAEKDRKKWRDDDWILHHDNALTHTSHLVQQFLAKHGTAQLQQPPYSPDLSPCAFFLFPRLKNVLKGHRFEAAEDIKRNSTKTLLDIPREDFAKCFQQWQKRWAKCVAAEVNYVEDY